MVVFSISELPKKNIELGLTVTYETNHDLAFALNMLPFHAFERRKKIGKSYVMNVQKNQKICHKNCLEPEKLTACVPTSALTK